LSDENKSVTVIIVEKQDTTNGKYVLDNRRV